jgi:DNA polymerase-3 subunit alpha/error-prone DNA polymerase
LLEKILDETYGILCYQEDISKTVIALAEFNDADADKLRKVIVKKMGEAKLVVYKNQFFVGCRKNNVTDETIQKIWEMMLSFDGYSFCKPHSASYVMVSFQSAYLRVHHPAEFMASVLSNQGGSTVPTPIFLKYGVCACLLRVPILIYPNGSITANGGKLLSALWRLKGFRQQGLQKY